MTKTPIEALQELNRLKRLKDAGLPYSEEEKQRAWNDAFEAEESAANTFQDGWLPIESAPRDGTEIMATGKSSVIITYMNEGDWGKNEHEDSPDCWCKPIQDEEEPSVWIHNDPWQSEEGKPKQ